LFLPDWPTTQTSDVASMLNDIEASTAMTELLHKYRDPGFI
jgi:hypothetical protein